MTFLVYMLRPAAARLLAPPERLPLMAAVLNKFFPIVWICIAALLLSGFVTLARVGMAAAPPGWHVMAALGVMMTLIFAHLFFGPYQKLRRAIAASDWASAGRQLARMHPWVLANLGLGWAAVLAILLLRA
ncbi:CopD family protein [Variovorax sp. HJSM1_2]|uniref:CopD family protein n=1 Tax=Variovorax sp. HJSM1_2 TaxID=3366263 RepID=UPI003BC70427